MCATETLKSTAENATRLAARQLARRARKTKPTLFAQNGWGDSWRNGIYDYVHYHPRSAGRKSEAERRRR